MSYFEHLTVLYERLLKILFEGVTVVYEPLCMNHTVC